MNIRLEGEPAQIAFGQRMASHLSPPCSIYLQGDLGTGKTTLVRGVLRGLGYTGAVRSPTYTLLEPYDLQTMQLYHLDLYRLADPEELELIGLRDLLEPNSVLLVEWPERGEGFLPQPDLRVRIRYGGEGRDLELLAESTSGRELESKLAATASATI